MSNDSLNYSEPHFCPIYNRVIDVDLCYDSLMALNGSFKITSVEDLNGINDIDTARRLCKKCPYSDLS